MKLSIINKKKIGKIYYCRPKSRKICVLFWQKAQNPSFSASSSSVVARWFCSLSTAKRGGDGAKDLGAGENRISRWRIRSALRTLS